MYSLSLTICLKNKNKKDTIMWRNCTFFHREKHTTSSIKEGATVTNLSLSSPTPEALCYWLNSHPTRPFTSPWIMSKPVFWYTLPPRPQANWWFNEELHSCVFSSKKYTKNDKRLVTQCITYSNSLVQIFHIIDLWKKPIFCKGKIHLLMQS